MKPIRLIRQLRLNNLELFQLREDFYGRTISYMLIMDFRRASTLDDFPELEEIEDEEGFGRRNFIKVLFLHDAHIEVNFKDELVSIAGGFLENKDDCHWNCSFEEMESKKFLKMTESRGYMIECISSILLNCGYNNKLNNIKDEKFNYLSQD
ncbi:hypothetical protein HAHI6034_03140 [Hathewaya histolytica]|uniref:Uncharacterized protein n=1 Tax=Hathewaya histolytica TaxID=1498 RepID=A0A4U9R234_HATHI|nr:hypothetical protein [Hathewaya histolytica]VTQ85225.1 Uncharacterised protein [Hathewaya histolytica]